jgi:hypothetical protein
LARGLRLGQTARRHVAPAPPAAGHDLKPIVTVTLKPCIDGASETEVVRPTRKIRTTNERSYAGGGGVNVARVIAELGGPVQRVCLNGGAIGPPARPSPTCSGPRHPARCRSPTPFASVTRFRAGDFVAKLRSCATFNCVTVKGASLSEAPSHHADHLRMRSQLSAIFHHGTFGLHRTA